MGRKPCCREKVGINRGGWTASEDQQLIAYIKANGEGKWRDLPKRAGLKRCGKSCRLRWMNYLNPKIKRGNITPEEEDIIVTLQKNVGNRWSLIAERLHGRTDNEIKNYWKTILCKKIQGHQQPRKKSNNQEKSTDIPAPFPSPTASMQNVGPSQGNSTEFVDEAIQNIVDTQAPQCLDGAITDLGSGENCMEDIDNYLQFLLNDDINTLSWDEDIYDSNNISSELAFSTDECMSDYWREIFESGSLASLSESQPWP